ncbi:MAG: hypothetical protein ACK58L_09185 [Planctomycetota bacterium]
MKRFSFSLPALSVLFLAGCTEHGGGASVVPTVTFIAADAGAAVEGDATGSEASDAATAAPGRIVGKVTLVGTAPSLPLAVTQGAEIKDKEVCAAIDLPDERLLLGEGGGVRNVFVYMQKAPKGTAKPETLPDFVLDQKNCRFEPHCAVLQVNQPVKVLSNDSVAHNTHTNPQKNGAVNSGVAPNDREGKLSFSYRKAEVAPFAVTCDYHSWMRAYHLPLDHPYAAVSDSSGSFTIADVPPGKHVFAVWHEAVDGNYIERKLSVEVKSGEDTDVKIDLPAEKLKL